MICIALVLKVLEFPVESLGSAPCMRIRGGECDRFSSTILMTATTSAIARMMHMTIRISKAVIPLFY